MRLFKIRCWKGERFFAKISNAPICTKSGLKGKTDIQNLFIYVWRWFKSRCCHGDRFPHQIFKMLKVVGNLVLRWKWHPESKFWVFKSVLGPVMWPVLGAIQEPWDHNHLLLHLTSLKIRILDKKKFVHGKSFANSLKLGVVRYSYLYFVYLLTPIFPTQSI